MARLTIKFRRRNEKKTDYKSRLAMLKSGKARLVIRKSNKYVSAEIITSRNAQDSVICSANSKDLKKLGWKNSFKNIQASYLTGFLIGTKAKKLNINEAILDIGINISTKGSRIYSVLKGALDAGLDMKYSEEIMPSEARIKGEHLKNKADIGEFVEKIRSG